MLPTKLTAQQIWARSQTLPMLKHLKAPLVSKRLLPALTRELSPVKSVRVLNPKFLATRWVKLLQVLRMLDPPFLTREKLQRKIPMIRFPSGSMRVL
jgi:hypothetical protein